MDDKCTGGDGVEYSKQDMYKIVREMLADDTLPEADLEEFMQTDSFRDVCPDLYEAFTSSLRRANERQASAQIKQEPSRTTTPEPIEQTKKPQPLQQIKPQPVQNIKQEPVDENKQERVEKMKQEPEEKIRQEAVEKMKQEPTERYKPEEKQRHRLSSDNSSHSRRKKKKKKHFESRRSHSSSSSSSCSFVPIPSTSKNVKNNLNNSNEKKPETYKTDKIKSEPTASSSKVHPYYLGQMGSVVPTKGKVFQKEDEEGHKKKHRKEEHHHKNKHHHSSKTKPFSFYRSSVSKVGKHWKPLIESELPKKQKSCKLKPVSILCVDLKDMPSIFSKNGSKPGTIPLKSHTIISDSRQSEIQRVEELKRKLFKPTLNKIYSQNRKKRVTSVSEEKRPVLPVNNNQKLRIESSDESDVRKQNDKPFKKCLESKKVDRLKNLKELRAKNNKKNDLKETQKLPKERKEHLEKETEKKKPSNYNNINNNNKKEEKPSLAKIPKQTPQQHAPAISFQTILNAISTANKEQAQKPHVDLKIPKLDSNSKPAEKSTTPTEVQAGPVAIEVDRMLRFASSLEIPQMPSNFAKLADYTIRKIAWWFLKEESDPPDEVIIHPEAHDDEIYEDWYIPPVNPDDDDVSIGNVSDPEGIDNDKPVEPILDSDRLDEYCGCASTEARIRRIKENGDFFFKKFIHIKPGSNYDKDNFEARCHLCNETIKGRRHLGAHMRSEHHKANFRNASLQMTTTSETRRKVPPTKIFPAKLVKYTVDDGITNPDPMGITEKKDSNNEDDVIEIDQANSQVATIESKNGQSPTQKIVRVQDIGVDDLSLPSLTMYDLEPDKDQIRAKICLRTNGLWTNDMENKWVKMQDEETRITDEYNDMREKFISAPETHPLKDEEWTNFWKRRSMELEAEGKDADTYDYTRDWVPFWLKRMQEIMKDDVLKKLLKMKRGFDLDCDTLKTLVARHGLSLDKVDLSKPKKVPPPRPPTPDRQNYSDFKTNKQQQWDSHGKHQNWQGRGRGGGGRGGWRGGRGGERGGGGNYQNWNDTKKNWDRNGLKDDRKWSQPPYRGGGHENYKHNKKDKNSQRDYRKRNYGQMHNSRNELNDSDPRNNKPNHQRPIPPSATVTNNSTWARSNEPPTKIAKPNSDNKYVSSNSDDNWETEPVPKIVKIEQANQKQGGSGWVPLSINKQPSLELTSALAELNEAIDKAERL